METAVAQFLKGAGLDVRDKNLALTPQRVADAWLTDFLDGYAVSPNEVLSERFPITQESQRELVIITGLKFHSMCPHHLLPYSGEATLAYLPGKSVVGFGRLAALLDCFAHRLVLQEELAANVAQALQKGLSSRGAACIVKAHQSCLQLRGGHQRDAVTHAEAYRGLLKTDRALRAELWARISKRTDAEPSQT